MITQVNPRDKAIAFTFDDGPDPRYTPQILDILEEVSGRATFYMVGEQMQRQPQLVRKVFCRGHEVGNHTFTHPDLTKGSAHACREELLATALLVEELTGKKPVTFRPPYLAYNGEVSSVCQKLRNQMIGAVNGEARDWEQPGVEHIVEATKKVMKSGSILLFHDGYGDRSQTVEAVRILTAEAVAQGLRLVTVAELLELSTA